MATPPRSARRTGSAPVTSVPAGSERLPLWSRPGYLVRRVHQIHQALFMEECQPFGITPVQYGLLTALATRGTLDQISLAEDLGIDRSNVAEVLSRLESRALISRIPNPADRRAKLASLTEAGTKLVTDMHDAMQRAQTRLLEPLAPDARRSFMESLVRLVEANDGHEAADPDAN